MIKICDNCRHRIDMKIKEMEAKLYKHNILCYHEYIKSKKSAVIYNANKKLFIPDSGTD